MSGRPPDTLVIRLDRFHLKYVGRTQDGRQFFLTTPFVPARGENSGREFFALYLFDAAGNPHEAVIDDLGPRATLDDAAAQQLHAQRLLPRARSLILWTTEPS